MYCRLDSIDSEILGNTCLEIINFDSTVDFEIFEKQYLDEYNPFYVICRLEATDVYSIHKLESCGFKFIEFSLKYSNTPRNYDNDLLQTEYWYCKAKKEDMNNIVSIANNTFKNDRIRVDKELCSMYNFDVACYRYESYLNRSYYESNQSICKIYNKLTHEIIGFFSYKKNDDNSALFLLGGISDHYKGKGLGNIYVKSYHSQLFHDDIAIFFSSMSGGNIPIINLNIKKYQGRIDNTYVVLRKLYAKKS